MPDKYRNFDRPEILNFLFHPRRERHPQSTSQTAAIDIPVSDGNTIGAKFFPADRAAPLILFFHGNGETVSDYDDLGTVFSSIGFNFLPVDYRGYGWSTGNHSVSGMISDANDILSYTRSMMKEKSIPGLPVIMGRSLGSASAIELASSRPGDIAGLIIESGFSRVIPLLELLGIDAGACGITDESAFSHAEKISTYTDPLLVIHAEFDHIIPYSDGIELYEKCSSSDKKMVTIKGANHNNIFMMDMDLYMRSVYEFIQSVFSE